MKLHERISLLFFIVFACGGLTLQSAKCADSKESASLRDALASTGSQPNVLFLSIDDLNDWIGALGGHPQAKTPNLDRLISKSVSFSNAHCAAPVFSASRHALLSVLRP